MGKREEKKQMLRKAILSASHVVFETTGFRQTTMEQIAAEAGVGVGTAYNYFSSKEELFLLAVAEPLFAAASKLTVSVEAGSASDVVLAYLANLLERVESYGKDVWRDVIAAFFSTQRSNSQLTAEMLSADLGMINGLRSLLVRLREQRRIDPELDVETCVKVIYSILTSLLTWYVFDERQPQQTLLVELEKQTRFVFGESGESDAGLPLGRPRPSGNNLEEGTSR